MLRDFSSSSAKQKSFSVVAPNLLSISNHFIDDIGVSTNCPMIELFTATPRPPPLLGDSITLPNDDDPDGVGIVLLVIPLEPFFSLLVVLMRCVCVCVCVVVDNSLLTQCTAEDDGDDDGSGSCEEVIHCCCCCSTCLVTLLLLQRR